MKYALSTVALALAFGLAASSLSAQAAPRLASSESGAPSDASLEELRATTQRFRDVKVALAEGYIPDPMNMCDAAVWKSAIEGLSGRDTAGPV